MLMNFGKFKGWHLSEIPLSYLAWIFETLAEKQELHEAARQEIRRRISDYELEPDLDKGRLQRVYRTLALTYHPDRGGDNGVMAGINLFYEALQ